MCGRLVLTANYKEKIRARFEAIIADEWLPPRYNITPGQRLPVITSEAPHRLQWFNWGFASSTRRPPLINARAETVHELPTFKSAFAQRRCLVLADGFYEWKRDPALPRPQPYFFGLPDGQLLVLAGLWQNHQPPDCLVITTRANELMAPIHDRMPVLMNPQAARIWLDPNSDPAMLRALLEPFSAEQMRCHPVSDRVNRAASEGEDLIQPVRIYEQTGLF